MKHLHAKAARRFIGILGLFLALPVFTPEAAVAIPGDLNNDGLNELITATVGDRSTTFRVFFSPLSEATTRAEYVIPYRLAAPLLSSKSNFLGGVEVRQDGQLYWHFRQPDGTTSSIQFGKNGDKPHIGDVLDNEEDRAGGDEYATTRPDKNGKIVWRILFGNGEKKRVRFGDKGDEVFMPTQADGTAVLLAVKRKGTRIILTSLNLRSGEKIERIFGKSSDKFLASADLNGDGITEQLLTSKSTSSASENSKQSALNTLQIHSTANAVREVPVSKSNSVPFIGKYFDSTFDVGSFDPDSGFATIFRPDGTKRSIRIVDIGNAGKSFFIRSFGEPAAPVGSVGSGGSGNENFNPGVTPTGGLSEVCTRVVAMTRGLLWKPASDDTRDCREGKIAFISRGTPNDSCAPVYAANGAELTKLGLYEADGHYGDRRYTCIGCAGEAVTAAGLASRATKAAGSRAVYVKIAGTCYGPINPTERTGGL